PAHASGPAPVPPPSAAAPTPQPGGQSGAATSAPVYLLHGLEVRGGTDCAATWRQATAELRSDGFRGPLITWGFYSHDTHCTRRVNGTPGTSVLELGRRLAWDIYLRYSRHGVAVRAVTHSMGGLVVASALAGVRAKPHTAKPWPPYLLVTDAVTLSTPFHGIAGRCSAKIRQCRDVKPGSALLGWLAKHPAQGRGGTDWTLVGATTDTRVPFRSALAAPAKHKAVYLSGQGITHYNLRHLDSGHSWRISYSNNGGATYRTTRHGVSPLHYAALALTGPAF
ncbi:hypothetical protein DZF91_18150, partial [Actinomadura logoneensis]